MTDVPSPAPAVAARKRSLRAQVVNWLLILFGMLLLVSFVGWIVLRFSRTYLDGEPRQGAFTGWLCLTLISVILLVTAAHLVQLVLSWIATSLCLHRLLRFYPDRIGARRAARGRSRSPPGSARSSS